MSKAQVNSPPRYGSEFKYIEVLEPLLRKHPLWNNLRTHLKYGVEFPLDRTTRQEKYQDVLEALKFGNHKGVKNFKSLFVENITKDVEHGFSLVIPLHREKN